MYIYIYTYWVTQPVLCSPLLDATSPPPLSSSGRRLSPSRVRNGRGAPAAATIVGSQSYWINISFRNA